MSSTQTHPVVVPPRQFNADQIGYMKNIGFSLGKMRSYFCLRDHDVGSNVSCSPLLPYAWRNPCDSGEGLIHTLSLRADAYPLCIWIIDNSSSMAMRDSHVISDMSEGAERFDCTRLEEMKDCVHHHAEIVGSLGLPCCFMVR